MYHIQNSPNMFSENIIHVVRYFISYPFLIFEDTNLSYFIAPILIVIYMSPVLFSNIKGMRNSLQLFIIYLPLFFSYRTVLVMLSIVYIYIYIHTNKKNTTLLLFYGFFSFLSSGVFLIWFFLFPLIYLHVEKRLRKWIKVFFVFLMVAIIKAFYMKFTFFSSQESVEKFSINNDLGLIGNTLVRNNIFTSFFSGQYIKAYFYLFFLLITLFLLIYSFQRRKMLFYFFLPLLFSFLFEGLGTLSYLITIVFFVLYNQGNEKHKINNDSLPGNHYSPLFSVSS